MRSPRLTERGTPAGVQVSAAALPDAIREGSRLTDRDRLVISLLAEHKVMTAEQLARVSFPNDTRARHRLLILTQRGVLARFRRCHRPGSLPWNYTLGLIGAAVHAAYTGAPLPRPAEITNRIVRLHYSRTLDHLLGVNEFFTQLIADARRAPARNLAAWWPETQAAIACGDIVRPDGYGEWAEDGATIGFFLEHDTGSETAATLLDKIDRYAELAASGITRPVLFHLPAPGRETNLHRAVVRRYGRAGPPARIATTTDHGQASPAGRMWLPATGDTGRRLRLIELGGSR